MGVREARDLIEGGIVKGFKFHPTCQGFFPNDRIAYKLYEVIAEHKLPAIFQPAIPAWAPACAAAAGSGSNIRSRSISTTSRSISPSNPN